MNYNPKGGAQILLNNVNPRSVIVLVLAIAVAACAPGGGRVAWPVESYANACVNSPFMPIRPFCLNELNTEQGFRYREEFAACRLSVENFVEALDRWRRCRVRELAEIALTISKEAVEAIRCLESLTSTETADFSQCKLVQTSFSARRIYGSGFHNPPLCVREESFVPEMAERRWRILTCRYDVGRYLKELAEAVEDLDQRLRRETKDAADDATRIFNCMAKRERFCI